MNQLAQVNRLLIFIILIVVILYWGAPFLITFIFGVFFAFLMVPLCNFLEKIGLHRVIGSLLSTMVLLIVFGGTLLLFVAQVNLFVKDLPSMQEEVDSLIEGSHSIIESITNISQERQEEILNDASGQIIEKIQPFITGFFANLFGIVFSFFLILVYVFLLLLYRKKIFEFMMMYIPRDDEESAKETVLKISKVAFQYLWGRSQVMILLGVMFYITFLLFGLPYALLFALFGAVITIIPYAGPLLSGLLPILFSFLYFDSMNKILFFAAVIIIIQFFESYVLEPLILGKEVKLNPMVIILAIVVGGLLWGVAGMILFVPMIAIVKIIALSRTDLRPIGFLLGQKKKEEFIK